MLHFPYQTFNHVIDFLREAAITLRSPIYDIYWWQNTVCGIVSPINAARNGKSVTVVMELQVSLLMKRTTSTGPTGCGKKACGSYTVSTNWGAHAKLWPGS